MINSLVQRSVVGGMVNEVKAEYSKDDVPLDLWLEDVLQTWRPASIYPQDSGWTFTNPTRLDGTGAPMRVQQELMRHASIQMTMNVYGQAMTETKRLANSQVVELVFTVTHKERLQAQSLSLRTLLQPVF